MATDIEVEQLTDPETALKPHSMTPRLFLLVALFVIEAPFVAFLFDPLAINASDPLWLNVRAFMRELVPALLFFGAAVAIIFAPRWKPLLADWTEAGRAHHWRTPLAVNLLLFLSLIALTLVMNTMKGDSPPWGVYWLWVFGAVAMYGALALAAAPLSWHRRFLRSEWPAISLAASAAFFVTIASVLSRQSWNALSEATFHLSAFILSLYEQNVVSDPLERDLGAGDFLVNIAAACSGYEGIGMVIAFLAIYLWIFRSTLKFPNAWLLLPIGVTAIWLLNSVRIAALISLGAHVSPEIAITGFHSQAGWMMFLAVTIGLMAISHRMPFFSKVEVKPQQRNDAAAQASALLAPFLAITAAGIFIAAFTVNGQAFYGLKVAAGIGGLWLFRHLYKLDEWRGTIEATFLGITVGVVWILTDPAGDGVSTTEVFVQSLTPLTLAVWITVRLIGTVFVIPIAEELAFRGYLHRMLSAKRFEDAAPAMFTWRAFLISSILFGAVHERWLAGALAGAVFAIALYRSGRIGGAIIAHIAANAVIAVWAIAAGQWSLL